MVAHLGGGANSEVSLASVDGSEELKLAVVKRLKLGADAEPDVLAQFADEARLSLLLKHANIAAGLTAGQDSDGPFLVIEYLDGQTLARIRSRAARQAGGLPRPIALYIVMAIAAGLAHAHELKEADKALQLVHRDVSPENILVGYDGSAKLVDFSASSSKASTVQGRAAATKGNIWYMAPEQAKVGVNVDARADVFALGLVLWELLAGKRMWEGMSEADVIARLTDEAPLPKLRTVVPDIPDPLDGICSWALEKVRDDRFENAGQMREALEQTTRKLGLTATPNEVGSFVASLFEEDRAALREKIVDAVAAGESSRSLPRLMSPSSSHQLPALSSNARIPTSANASGPVQVVEVVKEAPSNDRRFTLVLVAGVLVAFCVVAIVAMTAKKGDDESAKPVVTARPANTVPVEPAQSAWVEPEEVTIEISVTPPSAALFVDGVKTGSTHYRTKVARGTYVHDVRAEAEGFDTRTTKIVFDRDRTIELALVKSAPTATAARRGAPPARPNAAPSAHPDTP
ncbi:serine/threonine protein kinase [Labilithrix luteola]|uniref:Serine/threonine protein kinase n=1 Tax=Labilithrix luteola TaxID=1391654 RepID=A0A0K1PJN8_9BACT|nr:serine/threonine protein kinase [Labilithrix luteola]